MKLINLVFKLFVAGAILCLSAMIAVVTIQVYTRLFMESAPHWTEEAARIFFIYAVAFGTAAGIRNGDFVRLDIIGKYLPSRISWLLNIITDITVAVFAVVLFIQSLKFVQLGMDELSPALEITMGFVFISIAIMGLAIAFFTTAGLLLTLYKKM